MIRRILILTIFIFNVCIEISAQDVALVQTRQGWGCIRRDSSWLIQPQFEALETERFMFVTDNPQTTLSEYSEGMCRYSDHGVWGFFNYLGEKMPVTFSGAKDFSDSLAAVKKGMKWGYVNKKGEWVIQPQFYDAENFSEGFAAVKSNKAWGYIGKSGNWLVEPKFEVAFRFKENFAAICYKNDWGYINKNGAYAVEPKFIKTLAFRNGIARIRTDEGWGFMDTAQHIIVNPVYYNVGLYNDGFAWARVVSGNCRYLNLQGKIVSKEEYRNAEDFSDNVGRVRPDKLWGYLDSSMNWLIQPKFLGAEDFVDGIARVRDVQKWFYINKKGEHLFDNREFDHAEDFSNGLARVEVDNRWGYMDTSGKWFITPQYKNCRDFKNMFETRY